MYLLRELHMRRRLLTMTAAEKAMQDIGAALESYFNGAQSEPNALNSIARIVGRYDIERIGEGPAIGEVFPAMSRAGFPWTPKQ